MSNSPGRKRRVLVINQFALPREEGGGTRHIDLFGRLDDWRPLIIAGDVNHYTAQRFSTPDARFALIHLWSGGRGSMSRILGWLIFSAKALLKALTVPSYDVLVASTPHLLAPVVGRIAARLRRAEFVLEIRDLWPESIVSAEVITAGGFIHRVLGALERWVVTGATHIIVVTEGWEDHLLALGAAREKITVVPNGTELSDFVVLEDRASVRRELDIDGFTAVFAGAHGPKDGIELVIDAARQCPDVNVLLVGDGPVKAAAIADAHRLGLSNVEFRSPIPKRDLPRLLYACDLGIHAVSPMPVFEKGMSPNKLFDYLAAGLPVVSNARRAIRRIVEDGQCGRVGETGDLASCMQSVYNASDAQKEAWSVEGRRLVAERFSRTSAAQSLGRVLDATVTADRPDRPDR